jgi:hypothetical protein
MEKTKMKERSVNVIENKGQLLKMGERCWNVYENKGSYPFEAGM